MTRKLCSLMVFLFLILTLSSCSLFESSDNVSPDDLDGQSLSIEDEIEGEDDLDAESELLDEGDDLVAGNTDEDDSDDFDDEDLDDKDFGDDESSSDAEVAFGEEDLDDSLVSDELEGDEGQQATDNFIVDAEPMQDQGPVIDEPGPEAPVADIPQDTVFDGANKITNLAYKAFDNGGTVVIETETPAQYQVREEADLNQMVIEVDGVKLPERFKRPYITKDFKQDIATINAYQDAGGSVARIVIQLKRPIKPVVQQEGSSILVMTNESSSMAPPVSVAKQPTQKMGGSLGLPDNSNSLGEVRYMGEKISIEVNQEDIRNVIENIAEQSGVNLIMDKDVSGPVSMRLRDIPWDQALMVILKSNGYGYVKQGNVLRISRQATLSKEAEDVSSQIQNEKKAKLLAGGLKVKYIPVSYANVEELQKKLKDFTSEKGKITFDDRTSSLVITDYEEYIGRLSQLVKALDTSPMQVEIEGKLVEARDEFVREAGINWNLSGQTSPLLGKSGSIGGGSNPGGTGGSRRGFSLDLNIGTYDIFGDLTSALSIFERENKIKVLSHPRIVTMNKTKGLVEQTTQIPIAVQTQNAGGNTNTIRYEDLKLSLEVTPQITFKSDVIMDVTLSRDFASAADEQGNRELNKRKAKTTVMVPNGQTAVIGGIYQVDDTDGEQGIPWLKDIPLIGYLFKQMTTEKRKNELLLFLKPKIIKNIASPMVSTTTGSNIGGFSDADDLENELDDDLDEELDDDDDTIDSLGDDLEDTDLESELIDEELGL